jgi:hypothetical protein
MPRETSHNPQHESSDSPHELVDEPLHELPHAQANEPTEELLDKLPHEPIPEPLPKRPPKPPRGAAAEP